MQKVFFLALLTTLLFGWSTSLNAQPGVLDPNDPDVVFTATNRPPLPTYAVISKWGHSNRLTWSGKRPFEYGFKSYYFKGLTFRLKFPASYQHNVADGKKYPVLFFLHGLGERGDVYDNEYQLLNGAQKHAERVNDGTFDGFLIYSQSSNGFHASSFPKISELIDSLAKYVKADLDRIIISGLSSGGQSTWDFLANYSIDFAGALPIAAAQSEDKPTFSKFITVPIWTGNGGLDGNPDPTAVTDVVNHFRSLGGQIRQTYYPTQGHSVWGSFWNEPDYFPTLNKLHKANPHVYFGRTEFCPNDAVSVKMALHPGFNAYEWEFNGSTIPGATSNQYTATQYGTYRARFRRTATSAWSEWSPTPVVVQQKVATITPPITINGLRSNVLPAPDGSTTVPLMVPDTYASYEWRRVSDNALVGSTNIFNAAPGSYKVRVNETYGCSSSFSEPFEVISANGTNNPDNISNFTALTESNSAIRLDWNDNPNPVNNETSFEIYRSEKEGGPYTLIATTGADILTYSNTGLNPNTSYYYKVRAINNYGASGVTNEVTAKTATDNKVPTAPKDLIITSTSRYSVSLGWQSATDDVGVIKYDIYVDGKKAYSTEENYFTVFNLTQGQTYTFTVKARDFAGNVSPFSNQVTTQAILRGLNYKYYTGSWNNLPDFKTLTPVYTGNSPNTDLTQRGQNDNFAFLWEGYINIPVTGTYYFRTRSDDGSKLWLGQLNESASPYSFSGTPTVNNDGAHGAQDRTSIAMQLQAGVYPIAIAYFDKTSGESMLVSWNTPSQAANTFVPIPNSAFQDGPTINIAPTLPSEFTATPLSFDKVALSWIDNSDNETGFEIWRSISPKEGFTIVGTAKANQTSLIDSLHLSPNTTYYYKMRVIGASGESILIPANDVQAIWQLNNNYLDLSGNNRNLLPNNGPTFSNTIKREGSHSVNLDGTNDDMTVPTSGTDYLYLRGVYATKTIAFWMKSDVVNSNRGIFDFGGSDDGLAMRLNANQLVVGIASNNVRRSLSVPYDNTNWNHIALVYNANTLKLYVNAQEVAIDNNLGFTSITATNDGSMIGDDNNSNALNTAFGQFDGQIDDFWLLGNILEQKDIEKLMNNTFAHQVVVTTPALPSVPAEPTSLQLIPFTSTIDLVWTDNSNNETSFEVWRSVNNNSNYRLVTTLPENSTSYTDKELFANVTYYYKVVAKGIGGSSEFSNEANTNTSNNLPVLQSINSFTMRYDSQKIVELTSTDADSEALTVSTDQLPSFASFTNTGNGTGKITFDPKVNDQGVYTIRAYVNDTHGGKDTVAFDLVVNDNYVPVITAVPNVSINENEIANLNLVATDIDGNESLQWQTTGLPSFAALTSGANGSAILKLTPNFAQAGTYPIVLSVQDAAGGVGTYNFTVTVVNQEPNTNKWFVNIQYNQLPGGPAPWNNVNSLIASNLKDQHNVSSSVGLQFLTTAWNPFNGGTVSGNNTGVYPDNVMRDYYYFGIFGAPETVDFRLSGLDKNYKYNITLLASSSWTGVANNGSTVFTIGNNSQTLYTHNNLNNTVTFSSLIPDANGYLTVKMSKAPGSQVGYLNAFVLEKVFDDGTAPVLPTEFKAENSANGSIRLTWNDIAYNELRYEVYRSTSQNGTYTLINPNATNNNATEYIDNTVKGLTTYFYKIAAVNSYGTSGLTEAVSIKSTNKAPKVTAINNVYLKGGAILSLNVSATDDEGEALVLTLVNNPSFVTFVDNGNGSGTISVNPSLNNIGLFKDVTIRATDNHGLIAEQKFDIAVSDNSVRSIFVNLSGDGGTPQGKPWNNFISYPYAGYTVSNLRDDQDIATNYNFKLVEAWTSGFNGGMITGNNSGIYPDNVIKSSIYFEGATSKKIQFTGLNPSKIYNIALFSSSNSGIDASFTISSGDQSLSFNGRYNSKRNVQLNGLVPNASGVVEVTISRANTATYIFLNAIVLQEYTVSTTPLRPIDLFTDINEPGKINLSWSDRSNNETGFEIWRATSGTQYAKLTTVNANVNTYTDNTAGTNIRYYYKVNAINNGTTSEFSNSANAILGNNQVLINLNLATPQATPWNNTNTTPQAGASIFDLKNSLGNSTGYTMALTNDWGGYFDLGMTSGILPDNVMVTSWWIEGNSQPGTMKLTNLDQSKRYRIGFMGSSSWDGDFTATYTINDRTVYLNSRKNDSKIVYIDNVVTDSNGELHITMGYLQSSRYSFLSAIIIEAYDDDSNALPPMDSQLENSLTKTIPTLKAENKARSTVASNSGESLEDELKVFPNPFSNSLNVNLKTIIDKQITLRLLDINGKVVLKKELGNIKGQRIITINSSELEKMAPGTYILQVIANGQLEKNTKLIKMK
jgi:predicted esterase